MARRTMTHSGPLVQLLDEILAIRPACDSADAAPPPPRDHEPPISPEENAAFVSELKRTLKAAT